MQPLSKRHSKRKRKPRRRRHYKTGVHVSVKCVSLVKYRSGWELTVCLFLDQDPTVVEYGYECLTIPYISNNLTGKIRLYYPDFLITYTDNSRKLVEVKRKDKLADRLVVKKAKAAIEWCREQKIKTQFEFWTNITIEAFQKMTEKPKKKLLSPSSVPMKSPGAPKPKAQNLSRKGRERKER